jgi:hypothetical protein
LKEVLKEHLLRRSLYDRARAGRRLVPGAPRWNP